MQKLTLNPRFGGVESRAAKKKSWVCVVAKASFEILYRSTQLTLKARFGAVESSSRSSRAAKNFLIIIRTRGGRSPGVIRG
jgi:predicted AAA+ superfamily ATPase